MRHDSFKSPDYLKLARKYKCTTVFTDSPKFPNIADLTGDFVYAWLMNSQENVTTGYTAEALDELAKAAQAWAKGGEPDGLPRMEAKGKTGKARDVFVYFVNGAKERAPAGAQALLSRLGFKPGERDTSQLS